MNFNPAELLAQRYSVPVALLVAVTFLLALVMVGNCVHSIGAQKRINECIQQDKGTPEECRKAFGK